MRVIVEAFVASMNLARAVKEQAHFASLDSAQPFNLVAVAKADEALNKINLAMERLAEVKSKKETADKKR